jgi:4-amino-4-deoxy-L-arabinose transferase-like glycosyltransferase
MTAPTARLLAQAVLIVALGAYLRIGAAIETEPAGPLTSDAREYFNYAHNLRAYGTYSRAQPSREAPAPDAVRNPGYPLLLAPLLDPSSEARTVRRIVMVQALVGTVVVGLVLVLALRLMPQPLALGATLLTAMSPHLVNAGVHVLTETLFSLVVLLALLALPRAWPASLSRMLAAGALFGWSALIRPTLLYFPLLLAALFAATARPARNRTAIAALLAGFLLVLAPWAVRNELQLGYASDPTLQINMIHHGLYPGFMYQDRPETFGVPYRHDPRAAEIAASMDSVIREALRRFREQPGRQLRWYLLEKPLHLWAWYNMAQGWGDSFTYAVRKSPYFDRAPFQITRNISHALHWGVVALAALCCVMVWIPRLAAPLTATEAAGARSLAALLLYVTLLHVIGAPFPRYSIPFRPELYMAAGIAIHLLHRLWVAQRPPTAKESAA